MDHDFLDGIDEHFERLMKINGNGRSSRRSNGRPLNGASRDRIFLEIAECFEGFSNAQRRQVLDFVRGLKKNPDPLDFVEALEPDPEKS